MEKNDVLILARKNEGQPMEVVIEAPTAAAGLAAISCVIQRFCEMTGIPVVGVLGRLAVVLVHDEPQAEPEEKQ